uniref:Uncharacterized protein n=1 Tax=Kalanchoe fedtschenkoi TaxID=63787 RepID=A0A7N0UM10_KALFE
MMKNRGKQVQLQTQSQNHRRYIDLCSGLDGGCEKHPSFASSGVCAFCLRDRLLSLVCNECGEQRLSRSCSCSSFSDVGSVGRISFLIENDAGTPSFAQGRSFGLKRSSSTRAEVKRSRSRGWRLSALFRRRKGADQSQISSDGIWVEVSRSRSLCSLRRGGMTDEDGGSTSVSGARSSSVTLAYSEPEGRRSGCGFKDEIFSSFSAQSGKRVSSLRIKESKSDTDFEASEGGDSGFIDLNLEGFGSGRSFRDRNGSVSIVGKRGRMRGSRVWRWIFGGHGQLSQHENCG